MRVSEGVPSVVIGVRKIVDRIIAFFYRKRFVNSVGRCPCGHGRAPSWIMRVSEGVHSVVIGVRKIVGFRQDIFHTCAVKLLGRGDKSLQRTSTVEQQSVSSLPALVF